MRGTPVNTPHCIPCLPNLLLNFDPHAAFEGTFVWATRLASPMPPTTAGLVFWTNPTYSHGTDQWLDSPPLAGSGWDHLRLEYRRWLTVDDATNDRASIELRVGGGAFQPLWQNPTGSVMLDQAWSAHAVDLAAADNQPSATLRFRMVSNASTAMGGWNIDALRVKGRRINAPLPLTSSGSTTPNSVWSLHVNGQPGDPYVIAAAVALKPTYYPGYGMASIDIFDPLTSLPFTLAGWIPASGQATHSFVVPASAATVSFQGLVGLDGSVTDVLITNVESVTFP